MNDAYSSQTHGSQRLVITIHSSQNPTAEWWNDYEQGINQLKSGADFANAIGILVLSDGGAPTTAQRHSLLNHVFEGRPMKVALISIALSNPIKRGIATALTWMNPGFKVFTTHQFEGALAHLGLPGELASVWSRCRLLQADLPPIRTLELIAQALGKPRLPSREAVASG